LTWKAKSTCPAAEGRRGVWPHAQEARCRAPEAAAQAEGPQGQFLWAILRNSFHYAAVHLATIADNARDVDFAMRWGFGMKQGPFELWQEAGWLEVAKMIQEDIDAGKALSKRAAARVGVQGPRGRGRWRAHRARFVEPVARQIRAARACRSTSASISLKTAGRSRLPDFKTAGKTLHERRSACGRWTARC
jgi:3-hydroxyacyl-CoA dehydrogenase